MEFRDSITTLMLRKPNPVSRIVESVPLPPRSVPLNGLPLWHKLPLTSKLPTPKTPKDTLVFSRHKLGEPLWISKGAYDLSDPNCYNVSYNYDPLHDPNLTRFFSIPANRRRMLKLGLINKDGWAICTLKEFNTFRKFLYNAHVHSINVFRSNLDQMAKDRLTMHFVEETFDKTLSSKLKAEKIKLMNQRVLEANRLEQLEKAETIRKAEKVAKKRLLALEERRKSEQIKRKVKAQEREEAVQNRLKAAVEIELERKIKVIRQWRTDEEERLKRLKEERKERKQFKELKLLQRWNALIDSQEKKIAYNANVLSMYEEDIAASVLRHKRTVDDVRYREESRADKIKLNNRRPPITFIKPQRKKKKPTSIDAAAKRAFIPKICCGMPVPGYDPEVEDAVSRALHRAKLAAIAKPQQSGTLAVLAKTREIAESIVRTPGPVLDLISFLLEETIRRSIKKLACTMIKNVCNVVLDHLKDQKVTKKRLNQYNQILQSSEVDRSRKRVSFSRRLFELHTEVDNEMKSSKDRKPTPASSATRLADIVAEEEHLDLLIEEDTSEVRTEKMRTELSLKKVKCALAKAILKFAEKYVNPSTLKITMPKPPKNIRSMKEVIDLVTEVIMEYDLSNVTRAPELRWVVEWLTYQILTELKKERRGKIIEMDIDTK